MSEEFKKAKKRTFYDVLGIPQDANSQTIKSAYYHMARRFHPDKNPETSDIVNESIALQKMPFLMINIFSSSR